VTLQGKMDKNILSGMLMCPANVLLHRKALHFYQSVR